MEEAFEYSKGKPRPCIHSNREIANIEIKFQKTLPIVSMPLPRFGLEKNCTIHELRQNIRKILDLT